MQRWEYAFLMQWLGAGPQSSYVEFYGPDGHVGRVQDGGAPAHVLAALSRLGGQGWDLVGHEERPGAEMGGENGRHVYWLKRPARN